jgi:hypothetical protein
MRIAMTAETQVDDDGPADVVTLREGVAAANVVS